MSYADISSNPLLNIIFISFIYKPARSAHWIECAKGAFNTEPRNR